MRKDFFGISTFLVKGEDLKKEWDSKFIKYLKSENFESWHHKGFFANCNWLYINLNTKTYAPGMPGIQITKVIGNHAITIDEFFIIYNIYKKYEKLSTLKFNN